MIDDGLQRLANTVMEKQNTKQEVRLLTGTFLSTETVDANLSKVTLQDGEVARWVRKFKSVGTMSAGDPVCLISNGSSYTILGVYVGDHTLADAGQ